MILLGSHLILLATSIFPTTLIITYSISVVSNHVYPVMPFMSYTGDLPIESCIFSFGVNITAALYLVIVFLRYNQVLKVFELTGEDPRDTDTGSDKNKSALRWGIATALGLSVTGSFQQYNAYTIHLIGAALCSYSAFAYFCYQTVLSRKLLGKLNNKSMLYFRAGLCLSNAAFLLSVPLLLAYIDLIYSRTHAETICWNQNEDGWTVHLSSSIVEWLMFVTNEAYVISFYHEFKLIRIVRDEILFDLETTPK